MESLIDVMADAYTSEIANTAYANWRVIMRYCREFYEHCIP